jgi:hypothetical protein
MAMDRNLMDILICRVCSGRVEKKEGKIACVSSGRKYPFKEGIPVMLAEAAEGQRGNME